MPKQQPIHIEINYDAQREGFGDEQDVPDARHVRVEVGQRKVKKLYLEASPDDPEHFCPVRIRPGSEQPYKNAMEFRAELDTDAIFKKWGFVENVPDKEFPIVITAELESPRTKASKVSHDAIVDINLNSIRWKWQPLVRDEKGNEMEDGPEQENTPIEVNVDGTRQHGFRLTLERWVWEEPSYKQEGADFVHYLSPDHKLEDMSVLALEPPPWNLEGKAKGKGSKRQIVTQWWTQDLVPPKDEILHRLPIETTIRVRAYPANSIKEHRPNKRPITVRDVGPLATREIPLRLGVRKWKTQVLSPAPSEPPVLLEGARPWEECVDVEFSLFDNSNPNAVQYFKSKEVEWSLRSIGGGKHSGSVSYQGEKGQTSGTWRTDDSGRVKFKFLPEKENALFLSGKNGLKTYAEFDVRLKGKKEGKAFPPADKANDEKAPSLIIDWAPKFDLGAFKLPFFIKPEATLDLGPEPDPEKAEMVTLTMTDDEKKAYCNIFRTGGTIKLHPVVPWEPEGKAKQEFSLKHYSLVIGNNSRKGDEKPEIVPVDPEAQNTRPATVVIPPRPDQTGSGNTVELKPKVSLHPDIERILTRIVDQSTKTQEATQTSPALPKQRLGNSLTNFQKLGEEFAPAAVEYLAEMPKKDLIDKRKPIFFTLIEIPPFLLVTRDTWANLGSAIAFHRKAYKRLEETMITFYYDVIQWGPVREMTKKAWNNLKESAKGTFLAKWLEPGGFPPGGTKIGAILREGNEKLHDGAIYKFIRSCKEPFEDALEKARTAIHPCVANVAGHSAGRNTALQALANARTKLNETVNQFSRHADEYLGLMKSIGEQAKIGLAQGKSKQQLVEEMRELLTRANTVKAGLLQTKAELAAQLTGQGPSSLFSAAKQAMQSDYHLTYWKGRQKLLEEISSHYHKGSKELETLLKTRLSDVAGEKAVLEVVKKFEKMPQEIPDMFDGLRNEGHRFIDSHRDEVVAAGNTVLAKIQALQKYRTQLDLPELPPGASRVNPGREWTTALDDLAKLEDEIPRHSEVVQEFTQNVKGFLDKKLYGIHGMWADYRMLVDQLMKDGLKKGSQRLSNDIREAADTMPPPPPALPEMGGLDTPWEAAKSILSWIVNAYAAYFSYNLSLQWWVLKMTGRLLLMLLNTFFRIAERLLSKLWEVVVSAYEYVLTTNEGRRSLSSLTSKAMDAAEQSITLGNFFDLPYQRELTHSKLIRDATDKFYKSDGAFDQSLDESIENGLKTGYEDYYPSQLEKGRELLYDRCSQLLNKDKRLFTFLPCEEDRQGQAKIAAQAVDHLGRGIEEYLATDADHKAMAKKGLFMPLWDLVGKVWQSWWISFTNMERLVDWIGWCIAWGLRLVAVVLALFTWWMGPVSWLSVIGLLTAASAFSAMSAIGRALIGILGYYPYALNYPRDVLLMQGVYYSMIFRSSKDRFQAADKSDLMSSMR